MDSIEIKKLEEEKKEINFELSHNYFQMNENDKIASRKRINEIDSLISNDILEKRKELANRNFVPVKNKSNVKFDIRDVAKKTWNDR